MAAAFKQNLEEWKNKLDEALHQKNKFTEVLELIETKTGVKRLHLALGIIAFIKTPYVVIITALAIALQAVILISVLATVMRNIIALILHVGNKPLNFYYIDNFFYKYLARNGLKTEQNAFFVFLMPYCLNASWVENFVMWGNFRVSLY